MQDCRTESHKKSHTWPYTVSYSLTLDSVRGSAQKRQAKQLLENGLATPAGLQEIAVFITLTDPYPNVRGK